MSMEIDQNLQIKPVSCLKKSLFHLRRYVFDLNPKFSNVKIQPFATFKSDQDPDPHWSGFLDPDPR